MSHRELVREILDDLHWWITINLAAVVWWLLIWFTGWLPGTMLHCNPYVVQEYDWSQEEVNDSFMFDWEKGD